MLCELVCNQIVTWWKWSALFLRLTYTDFSPHLWRPLCRQVCPRQSQPPHSVVLLSVCILILPHLRSPQTEKPALAGAQKIKSIRRMKAFNLHLDAALHHERLTDVRWDHYINIRLCFHQTSCLSWHCEMRRYGKDGHATLLIKWMTV